MCWSGLCASREWITCSEQFLKMLFTESIFGNFWPVYNAWLGVVVTVSGGRFRVVFLHVHL